MQNGLDFCREFVNRELLYKVDEIIKREAYKDAKSKYQELAQEKYGITPIYEVIDSWGLDHDKTFKVGVYLDKDLKAVGEGRSKQRAEQNAASAALDNMKGL